MGQSMMTHTCSQEAKAGQLPWVPYKMSLWHLNGMLVGLDTKCVTRALAVGKTKGEKVFQPQQETVESKNYRPMVLLPFSIYSCTATLSITSINLCV